MLFSVFTGIYRKEILFGGCYVLAHSFIFHNSKLWWLAHLAIIPLLAGIKRCSSRLETFGFGYTVGLLSNLITFYWMHPVTAVGYLAMSGYLAFYPALFSLFVYKDVNTLNQTWGSEGRLLWMKILSIASLWVLIEYLQIIAPVLGFGWGLMALSQTAVLPLIQIADIFGQLGVSLVVVFNNVAIFFCIGFVICYFKKKMQWKPLVLNLFITTIVLVAMNYSTFHYGVNQIHRIDQMEATDLTKVALIQGNIPQDEKWNTQIRNLILDKYIGLSRQAAMEKPNMMIWPETSFPGYWEYEPRMVNQIMQLGKHLKTSFLIGAPTFLEGRAGMERMNSAIQLSADGHEMQRHHKLRLVPYGEYIPFFKFIRNINSDIGRFSKGSQLTLFELPLGSVKKMKPKYFSVLICFEDTFADLCRLFVNKGASVLINITNDGWFGSSTAAFQHAQASVLRAVENRVPVLRAANTGISCYIDETGRVASIFEEGGKPILVAGFLTTEVQIKSIPKTLYTKYGESWLILLGLTWLAILPLYRKREESIASQDYGD